FSNSLKHLTIATINAGMPGPGSLTTRQTAALIKQIVQNGVNAGASSVQVTVSTPPFTGGTITGGQIQSDLYVVNPNGSSPSFQNVGEFTATVGTNVPANINTSNTTLAGANISTPGFENKLTIIGQPSTVMTKIVPPKIPNITQGVGQNITPNIGDIVN